MLVSLRPIEKFLKASLLVETMNEGVGSVDENGVFTFVNDQYSEILGYPPDEIVGKHWTDIFDKNAQNIIKGQLKKRKEGASDRYEVKYTRKDGKKFILNISPRSILTPDGEIKGSMGIISDITESKQTEEALREGEKKSSV